jgi:hypothetical protein
MRFPHGWEVGIFEKQSGNEAIIESIKHHNEEIAKNILAQFINLGTTGSGSRSLGESFEELFMMSLNSVADQIAEDTTKYVIKRIVDYNWQVDEYPTMKHGKIVLNVPTFLKTVSELTKTGNITTDIDLENHVRTHLGFMEKQEEEIEVKAMPVEKSDNEKGELEIETEEKLHDVKLADRRALTELEKRCVDVDGMEKMLNEAEDRYLKQVRKIRKAQIKELAPELVRKPADKVQVRFAGKLEDRIYEEMQKSFRKGKRGVAEEIETQLDLAGKQKKARKLQEEDFQNEEDVMSDMKDRANEDSARMNALLLSAGLFALSRVDRTQSQDKVIEDLEAEMAVANEKQIADMATAATMFAFNSGREVGASEFEEITPKAVYSSVLDTNVCDNCLPKDGVIHDINDPRFQTPNKTCLGGARCRCINIYVVKGTEKEYVTKSTGDFLRDTEHIKKTQKAIDKIDATAPGYKRGTKAEMKKDLVNEVRDKYGF